MAILKELEVHVTVNGQNLEEFIGNEGTGKDSSERLTRYVEAISNAEFKIEVAYMGQHLPKYESSKRCEDLAIFVSIDGQEVRGQFLGHDLTTEISSVNVLEGEQWKSKHFTFCEIKTTEELDIRLPDEMKKAVAKLGKIEVRVVRVKNMGESYPQCSSHPQKEPPTTLPEKVLKGHALSHRTSFGNGKNCKAPMIRSYQYIDSQEHPYAAFEFRYRSKKALQDMQIIPRSPSPDRSVSVENGEVEILDERPLESMTKEELIELVRKHRVTVKAEDVKIMAVQLQQQHASSMNMKQKPRACSDQKKKARHNIQVIDLVDD